MTAADLIRTTTQSSELPIDGNSTGGWGDKTSTMQTRKITSWTIASARVLCCHGTVDPVLWAGEVVELAEGITKLLSLG